MDNCRKRILHVTKRYPPYIGGTESLCHDTCAALKKEYEQLVFAYNDKKETVVENYEGINVIRVGVYLTIASQPLSYSYGRLLRKAIIDFKPDIIHFDYPNPFGAHHLLKAIKKTKWEGKFVLFWVMDIIKQKNVEFIFRKQTIKLINMADIVQMLSPVYNKGTSYLPYYNKDYRVLAPRVGDSRLIITEEQKQKAKAIRLQNGGKTICFFFGRHVEYKGIKHIIEADEYLNREKIVIYIAGSGPLTKKLKKSASKYHNIHFIGKLSNDDVNSYLLSCDIFLFPSITRNEAYGISLAEAMWFGKPAITFTIKGSGVNWVSIANETGLEVENGNSLKYAKAIEELSENKEMYIKMSKKSFERSHNLFSLERFNSEAKMQYDSLFESEQL